MSIEKGYFSNSRTDFDEDLKNRKNDGERVYHPDCSHNDTTFEQHYTQDKKFGHFAEDGKAYVITERETPRPWLQFLSNVNVFSVVSNTGTGFMTHANGHRATKYWETNGNYLIRLPNGKRELFVSVDGKEPVEFFKFSENYSCTARLGYATFKGEIDGVVIEAVTYVPLNDPCECWKITLNNSGDKAKEIKISMKQELTRYKGYEFEVADGKILVNGGKFITTYAASNCTADLGPCSDEGVAEATLTSDMIVEKNCNASWNVLLSLTRPDEENMLKYLNEADFDNGLEEVKLHREKTNSRNMCTLPDKNMEYLLNYWIKNQLWLTYGHDRAEHIIGYRDGLQDSWGYMMSDPEAAIEKILLCLSYMYTDGRCPRGFDKFGDDHLLRDFSDSPTWAPRAINAYIKETGNYDILKMELGFFDSDEKSTVEDHLFRALDFMYKDRGKNGLVHVRDGDWADGLGGINKYGADATSAWVTTAAFDAQNIMAELYTQIGDIEKAELMKERSAEYKKIVNDVAWDGNWMLYGFFEDGEPIGSKKNYEGKIWLNPQTWGIFTGIIDNPIRVEKMENSVKRLLQTPFGCMVNYPPYVMYGERNGRIQKQRPGMFLNSSVYNHAASFKVFSDIARGDFEDAYDTFMRCVPNHPDNSDSRRTSEPYAIGNVYYGPDHRQYGMNLFTWFTACPAWLIHGGFEEILGVKAEYNGISVEPHVPYDWDNYKVRKEYRGTVYNIEAVRDISEKGVWLDGVKQDSNTVRSDKKECNVLVKF